MTVSALAHASLVVSDLTQALNFYCGTLGLQTCDRPDLGYPGAWLALASGQQIHLLALLDSPDPVSDRRPGQDRHLAFSVSELDSIVSRLTDAGVPFMHSRSGRQAVFCRDPDGNALEFIKGVASP